MAYDDEKALGYRESVTIGEIDLDINDPNIDFSGDPKSHNTPKTTDDILAYDGSIQTYIFSNQQLEFGTTHFPILESYSSSPATLKIGEDIALSASATLNFTTINSNDVFQLPPPYDDRRVKDGDFWGLMYARNYFQNRDARLKRGYNPLSLDDANFQTEHYVIKNTSGITNDGKTSITLIDRLFFASESKAKAPVTTDVVLKTTMGSSTTPINFTGTNLGDKGTDREIVNGDTGMILIGDEISSYTITSYSSGVGVMALVRAQGGTSASNQAIDQTIQGCMITLDSGSFGPENITDFNRRLFNDFTAIGSGFIDDVAWDIEKSGDLSTFNFTNIITNPTNVRKLLKQTIQSSGSWMYFDTILNKILIGFTARFEDPVLTIDEDLNILEGTLKVSPQYDMQVTRATIRHNKLNFAESDDKKNYANAFQIKDDLQEADRRSGKQSEAKEIISNWYTGSTTDILTANSVVQLKVNRLSEVPNKFTFNLDAKDVGDLPNGKRLWYGSVIEILTRKLLNPNNTKKPTLSQITSVKPLSIEDTFQITAISYSSSPLVGVDLFITSDQIDFLLTDLLTTTEAREYIVAINSGVKITSSNTGVYSFDTGVFFAGATLKIINQGFIVGAGAIGGNGAIEVLSTNATVGLIGGDALNLQVDTTLDNLTGLVGGGGGGGGGGGADDDTPPDGNGGGGGGGGGDNNAIGGIGNGIANDGESGSFNFPGNGGTSATGGTGGTGGNLGEQGQQGQQVGVGIVGEGAFGGAGGKSITTNGNSLTITSGDNPDQIKGDIV